MGFFQNIFASLFGRRENDEQNLRLAVRWTNEVLLLAIQRDAEEVRIEPMGLRVTVQLRLKNNRRVPGPSLSGKLAPCVARHLKRMALLEEDNVKRRQVGEVEMTLSGKRFRVKVATQPLASGEHLYLKLIPQPKG